MQIKSNELSSDLVFLFLLCYELKLSFSTLKKLLLHHKDVFWKYIYTLFPALKINTDRFLRLKKSSNLIYNKLISTDPDKIKLEYRELFFYNHIKKFIEEKFLYNNDFYELRDILLYLEWYKRRNIRIDILLKDNNYICRASINDINYYKNEIIRVKLNDMLFIRTSEYAQSQDKDVDTRNLIETKQDKNVHVRCTKDLQDIIKRNVINVEGDIIIYIDAPFIEIDADIFCRNIIGYGDNILTTGNITVKDSIKGIKELNSKNIKAVNVKVNNINARNIEAYDIESDKITYYAYCIAYNKLNCNNISGRRNNSFHKCLDSVGII